MKFLLVVIVLGVTIYLTIRLIQRRGVTLGGGRRPAPRPRPQQRRPIAPDDDADFLRDLDREKDRKKRRQDETDT